jgi:hypothetical protein
MKLEFFSTDFRKNLQISNFTKISPVGAELFYADGRTDITKLIAVFRNYAKASKKNIPTVKVIWFNEAGHMAHEMKGKIEINQGIVLL